MVASSMQPEAGALADKGSPPPLVARADSWGAGAADVAESRRSRCQSQGQQSRNRPPPGSTKSPRKVSDATVVSFRGDDICAPRGAFTMMRSAFPWRDSPPAAHQQLQLLEESTCARALAQPTVQAHSHAQEQRASCSGNLKANHSVHTASKSCMKCKNSGASKRASPPSTSPRLATLADMVGHIDWRRATSLSSAASSSARGPRQGGRTAQLMGAEEQSTKRKRCESKTAALPSNTNSAPPCGRKRITGRHQLEEYLHLSRDEAAARVGCGITYFKQQCRAVGVFKWPRRQVCALMDAQVRLEQHQKSQCSGHCAHIHAALQQVSVWLIRVREQCDPHWQLDVNLSRFTQAAIAASESKR